ncbi:hypothetical protein OGM63_15290 [Plectonema radiosum NIES-515]|uniref:Uncharacterized protein n=1 Tax=Plectonema radiosum NIES-515 TaxID=2986073 RepID=A0ABT3B0G1_9CYAN|nr:hypothetical protein [Plectonema radiosum]MCV3214865.1 hypothetical protein [Plectonema radiosum NIES-515]
MSRDKRAIVQYGSVKNICEPKTLVETLHLLVSTYVNRTVLSDRLPPGVKTPG